MFSSSSWSRKGAGRLALQLGPAFLAVLAMVVAWPTIWPLVALMVSGLVMIGFWIVAIPAILFEPAAAWRFVVSLLRGLARAVVAAARWIFDSLFGDLIAEARRNRQLNRQLAEVRARYAAPSDRSRVPGFCLAWAIGLWVVVALASVVVCLFVAMAAFCPRCTDPDLMGVARIIVESAPSDPEVLSALAPATSESVEPLAKEEAAVISSTATITTPAPLIGIIATGTPTPTTRLPETTTSHAVETGDTIWTILTKWLEKYPKQLQIYCVLWTNDLHREGENAVVWIHRGKVIYLPEFCKRTVSLTAFEDPRDGGRVMLVVPRDDIYAYIVKELGPGKFHVTEWNLGYIPDRIGGSGFAREGLKHTSPLTFVLSFTVGGMGEDALERELNFEEEVPLQ